MSRMFLYLDNPQQPTGNITATYPIYELDLQGLADAGIVSWGLGGQITNSVNECYYVSGSVNNANVNRYLSTNIPHQQWQDGSILQARISRYVLDENDIYVPDPDYYSFEEIPIGQRPDDWGTAANYLKYVVLSNATINGQPATYRAYYNVLKTSTWDPSAQYVRDTNRSMIRLFYTKNGYSFGVYQGADCEGGSSCGPVFNVAGYSQYSYDFSNPSPSRYTWKNPSGDKLSIGGNTLRVQSLWYTRTDSAAGKGNMLQGYEPAAGSYFIFVHATYDNKDYYGTLGIYPQSFAEETPFTQINFSLFTEDFWGSSIIAGGGGESVWGNDGPTSVPQGGNGSWNAPSDNRGDPNGTGTLNIVSDWGSKYNALVATGYRKYHLAIDSSMGINSSTAFKEFCTSLWNPNIWSSFRNYFYNPIDSILVCHMLPKKLSPILLPSAAQSKIYAANTELTTESVPVFSDLVGHYHVGSVNINNYTDSFADYENTSIYIHLPYIGTKQLDISAVMDGQLAVDYAVDYFSGDVVAYIWTEDYNGNHTYRYTFKGNAAKQIPLAQRVNPGTQLLVQALPAAAGALIGGSAGALIGAGTSLHDLTASYGGLGVVPSLAKQGALGEALGYVGKNAVAGIKAGAITGVGIGRAAKSAITSGSQTITSNAESGGSATAPTDTQCYLIIQRPIWSAPENYRKLFGYPSDIGGTIEENFEGFLSVRSIQVENIMGATDAEKAEISQLMAIGVYVSDDFGPED